MAATPKNSTIINRRTLCVGGAFSGDLSNVPAGVFPANLFSLTGYFTYKTELSFASACRLVNQDDSLELLFVDTDGEDLSTLAQFIVEVRKSRPNLPIVLFSARTDNRTRHLLRAGADWHFTKGAKTIARLGAAVDRHLFRQTLPIIELKERVEPFAPLVNPYIVGRPLTKTAESLFTGRADTFAWIGENLFADPHPNALLLYGRRRIGKTSVLYQVIGGRHARFLRENTGRPVYPVYIDLQRLAGSPTEEWLFRFAREIYRQAGPYHFLPAPPENRANGESPFMVVERILDRLEEALPPSGLLLLAVDELEQLRMDCETGHLDSSVLPYLRSQIQHRTGIAFLFSGSDGLLDPYWKPFLNLAAVRELGPLTLAETEKLVREPLAGRVVFDDPAVARIWQETKGHAYHIQVICHRLVSWLNENHRSNRLITEDDIAHVIDEINRFNILTPLRPAISAQGVL